MLQVTSPSLLTAPQPEISIISFGSQEVGSQYVSYCVVDLPSPDLANFTTIQWIDNLGNLVTAQSGGLRVTPTTQLNETQFARALVIESLQLLDEGIYICVANFSGEFVVSQPAVRQVYVNVFSKCKCTVLCVYMPVDNNGAKVKLPW